MPDRSPRAERQVGTGEELSKRQERALRILDAAGELIQRWGYKKTAVDDIARQAGVAKGTIYLHWKTREDLFITLLLRESLAALKDVLARIEDDPVGISLSNVVRHSMYVIMTRPLIRALFVQDVEMLGDLLQQGHPELERLTQQKLVMGRQLLEFFRAKGALRTDNSLDEQLQIYIMLIVGALTVDHYLPVELRSSPEEATQRLAYAVRTLLEPAEPIAPEVRRALRSVWDTYAGQLFSSLEERVQVLLS